MTQELSEEMQHLPIKKWGIILEQGNEKILGRFSSVPCVREGEETQHVYCLDSTVVDCINKNKDWETVIIDKVFGGKKNLEEFFHHLPVKMRIVTYTQEMYNNEKEFIGIPPTNKAGDILVKLWAGIKYKYLETF